MRLCIALVFAFVVGLAFGPRALADASTRRVALVIANGQYAHTVSLKNPVGDATLIKGSLAKAGFEVVDVPSNLDVQGFRNALRAFQAKADGAQIALIYYAGHGIEARGKNWLIPTDATLEQDRDLDYEAIDLDLVLNAIEGAQLRVVVLDACRDNPFGRSWHGTLRAVTQGLAPVDLDDVLVIYSAGPGQTASDGTGANSPFAEALAKRLPQAGVPIQMLGGMVRDDVLAATGGHQRPYISASITGTPIMLVQGPASVTVNTPAAPAFDPRAVELAFWNAVADSNDPTQYKAYLDRYPQGQFADLAKLKAQARPKTAVEEDAAASVEPTSHGRGVQAGVNPPASPTASASTQIAAASRAEDAQGASARVATPVNPPTAARQMAAPPASPAGAAMSPRLRFWLAKAETGDPQAQANVGLIYQRGRFARRDYAEAMRWFRKSADQGYAPGQFHVGQMYVWGWGVPVDYAEGMRWYRKAADQGNALGEAGVGILYDRGFGVPQDFAEASRWFHKSADQGASIAEVNLGLMYRGGRGVAQDYAQAAQWFQKAADHGDPQGQLYLGLLYLNGRGVPQDYGLSLVWLRKSAEQGEPEAQRNVAFRYALGQGVAQDVEEARVWFKAAAAQGDARSQYWLANNP